MRFIDLRIRNRSNTQSGFLSPNFYPRLKRILRRVFLPSNLILFKEYFSPPVRLASPKGAMLTFDNFHASALASAERLGVDPHDRWLLTMPLYHIGGMSIVFRAAIYGIEIVLHSSFDVDKVHHALTNENITHGFACPNHASSSAWKNIRTSSHRHLCASFLLGGASAPESLLDKALKLNLPIALTYGLTEATSQVATSTPEQTRAKPGSVGKPLNGTTVSIVDESGKSLPNGEVGEIMVSGKTVMNGYLDSNRPDRFPKPEVYTQATSAILIQTATYGYSPAAQI